MFIYISQTDQWMRVNIYESSSDTRCVTKAKMAIMVVVALTTLSWQLSPGPKHGNWALQMLCSFVRNTCNAHLTATLRVYIKSFEI